MIVIMHIFNGKKKIKLSVVFGSLNRKRTTLCIITLLSTIVIVFEKKNSIFNSPNLNVVLTTFEDDCDGDSTAKCIDIIFQTALAPVIMPNNYVVVLLHKIYR